MNEIFWLSIALIVILFFAYKPLKRALKNTIDSHIINTKKLLDEAKNAHNDAVKYLKKLEKDLKIQNKLNEEKLIQNEHLLNSIKLESDKKIEEEIKRQFFLAEIQRKTDEEIIKKEIASKFLLKNINRVISEFSDEDTKNTQFLKQSLNKLDQIKITK
jgi:F0F1-type ATP synthase membrane subunit b/b'